MSKAYMNDTDRILMNGGIQGRHTVWSLDDMNRISEAFHKKGYIVNCGSRLDSHAVYCDALQVQRDDAGVILEHLFQQRINVEASIEESYIVSFIMIYHNTADEVLRNIRRLPRSNKEWL